MAASDRAQSPRPTSPIAIVGLACRLPHAPTPAAFWRLLCGAENAVSPLPAGRWTAGPQAAPSFAGLLDRVDMFDAGFFGVPPREALAMDPQQRLMLELAWEALEDAGIRPETLAGSRTGVFASAIWDDYAALAHRQGPDGVTPYTMTGLHRSIIANRVSHRLGLRGPSLTVDAAQSSGLVAVHLACESLRQGDADLALVGGVNLILTEDSMRAADARFSGLSPDGRCYTFDARANGFVRGEGGGVLLLKPLETAVADGDTVYCVIRGSAVNNDGDTDGLTRPSAAAQEDVLRQAYVRAGVAPAEVQYVELHGTGTPVGDPIEAAALGAALGRTRPAGSPLRVGSAKTNVGHLEAAAGVVGLLKAALSIRHRQIPPSLNFATPHPDIPLAELGLRVQTELGGWPDPEQELTAGVSSFGMGGTNCHVVLTEAPADASAPAPRAAADAPPVVPWLLSAASPAALTAQADALRERLRTCPEPDPVDVGHSLATTRTSFTHRAVLLGADGGELRERLDALAEGRDAAGLVRGSRTHGGVAVLFSGQGSQRLGMGRELYAAYPVFAAALREACAALDPHLETPLLDVVFAADPPQGAAPLLDRTAYTQPALFAIEVALYRLAESWGLTADHLIGHSVGEIAAAHVAGVLSLPDAGTLVTARGRLMQSVGTPGAMAAWQATADEADEALREYAGRLDLAAVNGPASVVVSGDRDAVLEATASWQARGRKASVLRVSHAFHSAHMDGILAELRDVAAGLTFAAPTVPIVSDVTGLPATEAQLRSPDYWADHARRPVRFTAGVRHLCDLGVGTFVELGPDAALAGMARECFGALPDGEPRPAALAVMRRDRPEVETFVAAMAQAHVRGVAVDWERAFDGQRPRRVDLPTYAFQRERYWPTDAPVPQAAAPAVGGHSAPQQPAAPRSSARPRRDPGGAAGAGPQQRGRGPGPRHAGPDRPATDLQAAGLRLAGRDRAGRTARRHRPVCRCRPRSPSTTRPPSPSPRTCAPSTTGPGVSQPRPLRRPSPVPPPTSRSPSWRSAAATPAARTPRRRCGAWSTRAWTRWAPSPATAAGTWPNCSARTGTGRGRAPPVRADSSTTPGSSTPTSSGSARARRWPPTRSSASCWRCPGNCWNAPASTRPRSRAARPGSSSAPRRWTTAPGCTRRARGSRGTC